MREIIEGFFATGVSLEDARRNYAALYRTMGELVAFKRRCPGEDLTSALIAAGSGADPADPAALSDLTDLTDLADGAGGTGVGGPEAAGVGVEREGAGGQPDHVVERGV